MWTDGSSAVVLSAMAGGACTVSVTAMVCGSLEADGSLTVTVAVCVPAERPAVL